MDYKPQRITLRIPFKLHQKLMDEADKSCKSMNAEVLARLQESFEDNHLKIAESRIKELLREVIKEELAKNK